MSRLSRAPARASRRLIWPALGCALAATAVALWAASLAAPAGAQPACQTGHASFASTGAEQCYTVPQGVSTIEVVAVGGTGGAGRVSSGSANGAGGAGARVTAELTVTGGQTLYVEVGGNGVSADAASGAGDGGWNGGGSSTGYGGSPSGAGGGGGASDVRTQSCAGACPGGSASLQSRLLVAASGGGGGFDSFPSSSSEPLDGGAGGTPSPGGDGGDGNLSSCAGGAGATQTAAGQNGSFACPRPPTSTASLGTGATTTFGGGGGAGVYGGGAGAAGEGPQTGGGGGSSYAPAGATYALDQTATPMVTITAPPVASTDAASDVGVSSATLNGTVNPDGLPTTYHFDYGTSTAYGQSTATAAAGSDDAGHAESAPLTGLLPLTTYHFRIVATSTAGTSVGADQTFTTGGLAPTARTGPAQHVTQTTATITGTVDPNGLPTTYRFDYGTSTAYGRSTLVSPAGSGSGQEPESASLSDLRPATTYHYRIVAISAAGQTSGGDRTFTTPAKRTVIHVHGRPYPCARSPFILQVTVLRPPPEPRITARLDGRTIASERRSELRVRIDVARLRPGAHRIRVTVVGEGYRAVRFVDFARCAAPRPPSFTG
jgi:hypothetical protein